MRVGIADFVSALNKNKEVLHREPLYFEEIKDGVVVEAAIQYHSAMWRIFILMPTTSIHRMAVPMRQDSKPHLLA